MVLTSRLVVHGNKPNASRPVPNGSPAAGWKPIPFMKETVMFIMSQWNPFREMEQLQRQTAASCGPDGCRNPAASQDEQAPSWTPRADVFENGQEYIVQLELPGARKEDLNLNVESGILTIRGERKLEPGADTRLHRIERPYGSFQRRFVVPEDADPLKIRAEFKDGLLRVSLGKDPARGPKAIVVQ
jgi:HSP20 family protein